MNAVDNENYKNSLPFTSHNTELASKQLIIE